MPSASLRKLRRLNGRLQACDPCRRRKVACDHEQPVCQRCLRKKEETRCTYTISAHSISPFETAQAKSTARSTKQLLPDSNTVVSHQKTPKGSVGELGAPADASSHASIGNPRPLGYLGYASYTTVMDEAREGLPIRECTSYPQNDSDTPRIDFQISEDSIARGVTILQQIPTVEDVVPIKKEYFLMHDWVYRIAVSILEALYVDEIYGAYLVAQRNDEDLRRMARAVSISTAQPVNDELEGKHWVAHFTGHNLRWESIGLLLTIWELARRARRVDCKTSPNDDGSWRKSTNSCLELCDELSMGNLLVLYLHHRSTTLESMTSGDASLLTCKSHARAVGYLTFLGYHAEVPTQPYIPTLASELKRVVFASIYDTDKTLASFTSRPPLLARAFTTTPLPLDLESDDLFGPQSDLEFIAMNTLDERGWSKKGILCGLTCYRARGMINRFRDEILAIALGSGRDQETNLMTLLDILQRQAAAVDEFPDCVTYQPQDISDSAVPTVVVFTKLMIALERLQNDFFLDRLLLRRNYDTVAHLLLTSYRMVSHTLALWTNFERFAIMKTNFQWMLMAYGAPAGGILCKELQRPTLQSGGHPEDPQITRSSIIQKLSLLVAFLGWVDPAAPNADLCIDCKSAIEMVLNHTLNNVGSLETPSGEGQTVFEFTKGLEFDFDLMDSFDWLAT